MIEDNDRIKIFFAIAIYFLSSAIGVVNAQVYYDSLFKSEKIKQINSYNIDSASNKSLDHIEYLNDEGWIVKYLSISCKDSVPAKDGCNNPDTSSVTQYDYDSLGRYVKIIVRMSQLNSVESLSYPDRFTTIVFVEKDTVRRKINMSIQNLMTPDQNDAVMSWIKKSG